MKYHGIIFCTISLLDGKHDSGQNKDVTERIKRARAQFLDMNVLQMITKQFTAQLSFPITPSGRISFVLCLPAKCKSCFARSSDAFHFVNITNKLGVDQSSLCLCFIHRCVSRAVYSSCSSCLSFSLKKERKLLTCPGPP